MIKHIVMWKLRDPADTARFTAELQACRDVVPGIVAFEVAASAPGLEANMDVLLYAVFADREALAAYHSHPRHRQAAAVLGELRQSRTVLDYEA